MSVIQTRDLSGDAIRDGYRAFFGNAFMPHIRHEQMLPGADERVPDAAKFAAFQLGQIDEKLGRLVDFMESTVARRASRAPAADAGSG